MARVESLPLLLKQLGLPTILSNWENYQYEAQEKQWNHAQYLTELAEIEANNRY